MGNYKRIGEQSQNVWGGRVRPLKVNQSTAAESLAEISTPTALHF